VCGPLPLVLASVMFKWFPPPRAPLTWRERREMNNEELHQFEVILSQPEESLRDWLVRFPSLFACLPAPFPAPRCPGLQEA